MKLAAHDKETLPCLHFSNVLRITLQAAARHHAAPDCGASQNDFSVDGPVHSLRMRLQQGCLIYGYMGARKLRLLIATTISPHEVWGYATSRGPVTATCLAINLLTSHQKQELAIDSQSQTHQSEINEPQRSMMRH